MSGVATVVCVCETREQHEESEARLAAVYRGLSENILKQCGPILGDLYDARHAMVLEAQ